jgi:beta-phosphoglucomutase
MIQTNACIFDLDGVIVDTARYHFLAWKRLASMLGINFTEKDNERLKGVSRIESLNIILEIGNKKLTGSQKEEYALLKNSWYIDYISRMTPAELLPGSVEFIYELRNSNILVALGSASKNTPMILKQVGILDMFDAVIDGNVVSKAKPDPEVFLRAAQILSVEPAKCMVFEDAIAGVQAALKAGMICVGVGSPEILTQAHFVIPGLKEMTLEKLENYEKNIRLC